MAPPKKNKPASNKPRVSKLAAAVADPATKLPTNDGDPLFPHPGDFRCVFNGLEEGETADWYRARFTHPEHGDLVQLHLCGGTSMRVNAPRIKALAMATLGYDDEAEYNAFDPHGLYIEAIQGIDHDERPEGFDKTYFEIAQEYVGTVEVNVKITKGKEFTNDKGETDWFRNPTYSPVSSEGA